MGLLSYEMEVSSVIPAARMFKAFVLDSDNLFPKILPQAIKSVETIEGDGGPGSIKLVSFGEGSHFKNAKHRIDEIDEENMIFRYSVIDGDALMDVMESVDYVVKIEALPDGGSICKNHSTYHTKGDFKIKEEQIRGGKLKALAMFQAVEAYLQANPDLYN